MNGRVVFGIVLLILGLIMALQNVMRFDGLFTLTAIGLGFIIAYFLNGGITKRHNLGLLLPGTIIMALGVNNILKFYGVYHDNGWFFILLGIAFLIVSIHTLSGYYGGKTFWPLYTGAALILFGLFVSYKGYIQSVLNINITNIAIAVILIVIGVIALIRGMTEK